MKKIIFIVLLFFIAQFTSAQTIIGGVFQNDTLTLADSPYRATNNLLVPPGVTVVVEPGVIIYIDQGVWWKIDGELRAIGTAIQPVKFTRHTSATSWAGFWFTGTSVDYDIATGNGSILSFCIIEHVGNFSLPLGQEAWTLLMDNCAPMVVDCEIRNFWNGVWIFNGEASVIRCNIHDGNFFPVSVSNHGLPLVANVNHNIIHDIMALSNDNISVSLWGGARFIGNCVYNLEDTVAVRAYSNNVLVDSNNFVNCHTALAIYGGFDSTLVITHNIFYGNSVNLMLTACERAPVISQNNFLNYGAYHIYVDGYFNLSGTNDCINIPVSYTQDLQNNYWGGLTAAQMDAAIWDFNDDFVAKVIAGYSPVANSAFNIPYQQGCSNPLFLEEYEGGLSFSVFPNPVKDVINIDCHSGKRSEVQVEIINLYGQVLDAHRFELYPGERQAQRISMKDFAQGFYFARVSSEGVEEVKKIVKE